MTHHAPADAHFDPDAAAAPTGGCFGLPEHPSPLFEILPIPFEATTSYRRGTAGGPEAVLEASLQVDLEDARFGPVWHAGIHTLDAPAEIAILANEASRLTAPIIERGGATDDDQPQVDRIDAIGEQMTSIVRTNVADIFGRERVPAMLGGEHAISLGAIEAAAAAYPGLGVLQIDAHLDLRDRFEGFAHSHASVMFNALNRAKGLARIVAAGIRDHGRAEVDLATSDPRVTMFTDDALADDLASGRSFTDWCDEVIHALPEHVYLSFDIDGLEPALCPSTGTPVPGGFTWQQIGVLLGRLADSDRRVIGFDLVEVGTDQPIDAIVAARLLYRLCGVITTQRAHQ